jgi:hypothetical protein
MARTRIQSALGRAQVPWASGWPPGCGARASGRTIAHWKGPLAKRAPASAPLEGRRRRAGLRPTARAPGAPALASEPDSCRAAGTRTPGGGRSAGNFKPGKLTFRTVEGGAPKTGKKSRKAHSPPHGAPGGGKARRAAGRGPPPASGV